MRSVLTTASGWQSIKYTGYQASTTWICTTSVLERKDLQKQKAAKILYLDVFIIWPQVSLTALRPGVIMMQRQYIALPFHYPGIFPWCRKRNKGDDFKTVYIIFFKRIRERRGWGLSFEPKPECMHLRKVMNHMSTATYHAHWIECNFQIKPHSLTNCEKYLFYGKI